MSYYLKYLKYKKKYLDLKNLDLIDGLSLGNYNYNDFEGGTIGLKSDIDSDQSSDHYNIREISKFWKNNVSEVSHSAQPGYFLMYQKRVSYVAEHYKANGIPKEIVYYDSDTGNESRDNHIHLIKSTVENRWIEHSRTPKRFICIKFCLKINGFGVVVPKYVIDTIKTALNNSPASNTKEKELIIGNILGNFENYKQSGDANNQEYKIELTDHKDGKLSSDELSEVINYLKLQAQVCLVLKNKEEILTNVTKNPDELRQLQDVQRTNIIQQDLENARREKGIKDALKYLQGLNPNATIEEAEKFYRYTMNEERRRERDIDRIFNKLKSSGTTMDNDALKLHANHKYNEELAQEEGYNLYSTDEYKELGKNNRRGEGSSRSGHGNGYGYGRDHGHPGPSYGYGRDRDHPDPSYGYGRDSGRERDRDYGRERDRDYGRDNDREPASDSGSDPYNRDRDKRRQ
jgi:hypothetical protein